MNSILSRIRKTWSIPCFSLAENRACWPLLLLLFACTLTPGAAHAAARTYFMYFNTGTALTQPPVTTNTTCPTAADTTLNGVSGITLLADADDATCVPASNRDVIWNSATPTLSLYYNGAGYAAATNVTGTSVGIRARSQSATATLTVKLFYTKPDNSKVYFTGTPATQAVTSTRTNYTISLAGLSAANVPVGSKIGVEFSWNDASGMRLSVNQSANNDKLIVDETATALTYQNENCGNVAATYPWQDISATGTTVALADDATSAAINMGFTFNFGGTNYTQLRIGSNGWLFFGGTAITFTNTTLPSAVDAVVMPFWDDLNPGSVASRVRYQTLGAAPNRIFVVSYLDMPHYCSGTTGCTSSQTNAPIRYTFQAQFRETSNEIIFSYQTMGTLGGAFTVGTYTDSQGATVGVEVNNTNYTQFSYNTNSITSNSAIRFFSGTGTSICGVGPDHYELSLPAASVACLASTVTVTACADTSSPCTNNYAAVSTKTATLATSAGTLGTTTVTFDATGVATTTLSYPAATDGATATVTLSGEQTAATNPRKCCQGGTCTVANSCATTFSTAGFVVSASAGGGVATIPAQVAGTDSAQYYLRAVKTSTTTQACESALAGANTVNFAHECNNPTTCSTSNLMSVNGGTATTIARNNNGSVSSYTSVNMNFDVDGNAPFTFNYGDVGLVTLHMAKTVNSAPLSGASNAFVVKPGGFALSSIQQTAAPNLANPGAANGAGAKFVKAGEAFSATVTATTSNGVTATPNYGKETVAEGVKLTASLVAPVAGAAPALQNPTAFGAFTNGIATGTSFAWNEAGILTLTPSVGDGNYLGAGDVTGTVSGNVGRFYPDHLETAVTGPMSCGALIFAPACPTGNYLAYSGQPFTTQVTAYTLGGTGGAGITTNYAGAFARDVTLTAWDDIGSTSLQNPPASGGILTGNAIAAASFAAGVASASPVYTYTASPTAPTNVYFRAIDTDSVSSLNAVPANSVEGGIKVVSGRLLVENMYGPPTSRLGTKARALYWSGTQWALNTGDTSSGAATGNFALGDTSTCATPTFCGITLQSAALLGAGGEFRLILSPPTTGSGRRDVLLNSTLSYLAGSGRQTWGSFRSPYIHQQER